jgi:hypothetical protein
LTRQLTLDVVWRGAALLCLVAAYECGASGFDFRWLVALVLATFVVATGPQYWTLIEQMPPALHWPSRRSTAIGLVPGWVLLTAAAAAKASGASPRYVIWIWVAGAAWLLIGSWSLGRPSFVRTLPRHSMWWTRAAAAVVLVAVIAPRAWDLSTVPRYVHCDEGTITFVGQGFYADPDRDWFAPPANAGSYSIMNLHYALNGVGVQIGGLTLANARAADVLLGILSVVLVFVGLRPLAGLPVACAAALLLAGNHCHIAYSRIASGYIQTAFVVALDFALASRMWTRPTYLNASALGVAAAVGVQTYPASLISLPLLLGIFALQLLLDRERRRLMLVPLTLFIIACVTAGATFGVALSQHGNAMLARSREINILAPDQMTLLKSNVYHTESTAEVVALQAWNALLGFHRGRDRQPQYGIDRPLTDSYTAALMIPGLLLALARPRRFLAINALIWTAGYLLFGLGLQYAPGHNRTTGALPLGMVLPAIALVQCATTVFHGRSSIARALLGFTIAAGVTVSVANNLRIYFIDYPFSRTIGDEQSEAGWVVRDYADRYTVHLVGWSFRYAGYEGQRLIIGDTPVDRDPGTDPRAFIDSVQVTGSDLFVVSSESPQLRDHLMTRYPGARLELWQRHPRMGPVLFLIFVGPPRQNATTASRNP